VRGQGAIGGELDPDFESNPVREFDPQPELELEPEPQPGPELDPDPEPQEQDCRGILHELQVFLHPQGLGILHELQTGES